MSGVFEGIGQKALADFEARKPFVAAVEAMGVDLTRNERGEYTDSRTACLWQVWCKAQASQAEVETGFRPEYAGEVRTVEAAGKWLAKSLRDTTDDFGVIPRLVPAVVLSALMQACPDLIELKHAEEWPGSLTDHRARLRRALVALALSSSD